MEDKKCDNKLVNRLVKQSFGNGFKGTCSITKKYSPFDDDCFTAKYHQPNDIVRHSWFPIPFIWERLTYAGKFTNPDGSSLEVGKKFQSNAFQYAQLYKKETGKNVTIKINYPKDVFL